MQCDVVLPGKWVDVFAFERALTCSLGPHDPNSTQVNFQFPSDCKVMVDAGVRILSLANQLSSTGRYVVLDFEEGEAGTMGYLNRMGFFDLLSKEVKTIPERPAKSGAVVYGRTNTRLVEFERISPRYRDESLPARLADSLTPSLRFPFKPGLEQAAFTIFAELIDNVFQHSETPLDGYAALQIYSNGGKAQVAVSDSGHGILSTLRPTLRSSRYSKLSDTDLIVEMFRQGISRHGNLRGCGLKGSAAQAIKYKAGLDVRLATCSVRLIPSQDGYKPNTAFCKSGLPLIWGTHICFYFSLD